MRLDINHTPVRFGIAIVGIFLISLLFFLIRGDKKVERILLFPETNYIGRLEKPAISGEKRILPLRKRYEDNIRFLIEDVILGPVKPEHAKITCVNVKILSLIFKKNILYVNLSGDFLKEDTQYPLGAAQRIQAMGNNILFNFRKIKKLYIFIQGQIPDFSHIDGENHYNFKHGVTFSMELVK